MWRWRRRLKRWGRRAVPVAVLVALGIVGWQNRAQIDSTLSGWVVADQPSSIATAAPSSPLTAVPLAGPSGAKIVPLGNRPELDVPVARVTRWWVDHPQLGRVSVHVPIGTTPREALTVAFAERGYQTVR